jgi:competence protein ComEC
VRRSLTDLEAVVLALAVALGAWLARPFPVGLALGAVAAALVFRRPWLLCLAGLALASSLGARSEAGLAAPPARAFNGNVTLVTDPAPSFGGVEAIVRADGHRYQLATQGGSGGSLRTALAGEQFAVTGRIRALPPSQSWLSSRHVVGQLDASLAEPVGAGNPLWRVANDVRRTLVRGAASLGPTQRSLYAGFVLGDDRDQPVTTTDDFRGSGLTHLLAVSGENVAFVLALAGPGLRRLAIPSRWVATVALIAFFALLTRFEPSVLRASVMAGLAATASAIGRPATSVRILALALAALLLIDPLLVHSVGFVLSAAACAGIILLGSRLGAALPGPRPLAEAMGITIAAQLGVAPVQLATFGDLPVASLPANLLAAPAAGIVMMWGLGAGLVAGVIGGSVARVLHLPTRLGIGWIELVARWASSLPFGSLGWPHLAAGAFAVAAVLAAGRLGKGRRPLLVVGSVLGVGGLLAPAIALRAPPLDAEPSAGVSVWRAGGGTVVQIAGAAQPADVLEGLRVSGVRRIDLAMLTGGGSRSALVAGALRHRWTVSHVWAPEPNQVQGASTPAVGQQVQVGDLRVEVHRIRPHLDVRVTRPP